MGRASLKFLLAVFVHLAFVSISYCSEDNSKKESRPHTDKKVLQIQPYTLTRDMAFVSIRGSRPDAKKLQGFQRAVLFNAQGEVIRKIDMKSDSIFSLDKMIEENKTKGPLIIKMYR